MFGELIGPKGKPTATVLLNELSDKLPSNFVSPYSQISAVIRHHQRFFVQLTQMAVDLSQVVKVQTLCDHGVLRNTLDV